ncbi:hypothetical protein DFH09DRAFT_71517 [Mycena vulgaris]|nr:hypothetical protein DFH09DRAFT_71517 [Mycena vulgaris]
MRWTGSLFISLLFIHAASSTRFHKVINHIKSAQDKAFHDALLQQLADSRSNSSIPTKLGTSPNLHSIISNVDLSLGVATAATNSTGSYADGSTSSFQLYTTDNLPTSPAPPTACASALTATVQCNSTVPLMSSYPYLLIDDLPTVCTAQCTSSLSTYRANVASACKNFGISGSNNVTYLPTLAVDTIAGPYTVQCLQDPTSGQFCEPLLASFNSTGGLLSLPNSQLCTFCTLKTLNATLSNPVTYSKPVAQLLSSAITQCGSAFASYNVTAPGTGSVSTPPFGVNATTDPAADCAVAGRNISVPADTTCSAIAQTNSVTVYSVLSSNPFLVGSSDCAVQAGTKLCLFQACKTYQVAADDTCDSIADKSTSITGTKITTTQLQSFNPDLGSYCQLLPLKVGQSICLTPNGGFPNVGVSTSNNPSGTPTTFAPVPTPTVSGTTSNCGKYYQVQQGDICNTVVLANAISLPDFLTLNPEIDGNCTNLWLDYYYCVAPYPPLSASSAPPIITSNYTSATIYQYPLPTLSYTPSMFTQVLTAAGVPVPTNAASGTRTVGCGYYYTVLAGDTLATIADTTGVNSTALTTWNPELAASAPIPGTAVCVVFPRGNYTLPVAHVPSNVAPNVTTSRCAQYYTIASGDGCPSIEAKFFIDNTMFMSLNPGINSQCTNIVLGLAYCVFSIHAPDTSAPTGPPANVAPGTITAGCSQYYTVASGDGCASIESKFNLTLSQFVTMNPEINAGCTNLALAEAYCVASSNSTIPPNVAPGTITSGCTQYYTVASGDGCASIESKFGLTLAQFITMNPELNSGCTNLALAEAYCVASSNSTSTGPPANVAPGTITAGCTGYYTVVSGDGCASIESKFGLTLAQFIAMNPELNSGCTNLALAEAYCVASSNSTSTGPPANVAPGTITAGCTGYYTVVSGDGCASIESKFNLTLAKFIAMNPELNAGCTNLALAEAYCIGSSNSTSVGPPPNLAAGSLGNCTAYHTVASGNTCTSMDTGAGIAFADFLRWNPEINVGCTTIQLGAAYCVGGGGSACAKVYTVVSGDSCAAIVKSQGVTQARINALNPQINAACSNLGVGENICVG